ncbi:MAG: sel1 repeat family protein [Lachnospiraceae bacterium]|nr:sel1 repeat family protein [Lachnospiraceae bacterium]
MNTEKDDILKKLETAIVELQSSTKPLVLEYDDKYDKTEINELIGYCEIGGSTALYELASRYRCGIDGVDKDDLKAVELYRKVLEYERHVAAVKYIGLAYKDGVFGEAYREKCLPWFELGSKWGGGSATEQLGLLYFEGEFVTQDYDKAIELFTLAINQGEKHAYFNLGDTHRIVGNYSKAKYFLEKSIEISKVYYAYILLGILYEDGNGVEQNLQKAFNMYHLAYQHDIVEDGAFNMGRMYFYGRGVPEDNIKAHQMFIEALEAGIVEANYYLGILNYLDENAPVEKNAEKALEYLRNAPEHMQELSFEKMGYICEQENRLEEASEWYEKAAAMGNEQAAKSFKRLNRIDEEKHADFMRVLMNANIEQLLEYHEKRVVHTSFLIADAYMHGKKGAKINYSKAYQFYKEVVDKGYPGVENSLMGLADMYLHGYGVPKNVSLAIEYLENAAKNHFAPACAFLGETYRRGDGVPIDIEKAVYWHQQGAEGGMLVSHNCLSEMYFQGKIGNKQNIEEGLKHLNKVLAVEPENGTACWYMANFLYLGVKENGKLILEKDVPKAIQYFETAAKNGWVEAYSKLGDIFSDSDSAIFDYTFALECYGLALHNGYIWAAANIAAMHLLTEYQNQPDRNPQKGVEAAKVFLENGDGSRGLKEILMGMLIDYYEYCGYTTDYSQQGYQYLFNRLGNIGLAYTTEENKQRLTDIIELLIIKITVVYADEGMHGIEKVMNLYSQLENVFSRNSYIKAAGQGVLMKYYFKLGEIHLDNAELQAAKDCFEKAAWHGATSAEAYLRRFKTNIFGKLVYK